MRSPHAHYFELRPCRRHAADAFSLIGDRTVGTDDSGAVGTTVAQSSAPSCEYVGGTLRQQASIARGAIVELAVPR